MAFEIIVPRLNANDDNCRLDEFSAEEGSYVEAGQAIAVVSSSKLCEEIVADVSGYIHYMAEEYEEASAGDVLAIIYEDEDSLGKSISPPAYDAEFKLTAPAERFAREHAISEDMIAALGKKLIRKEDIAHLAAGDDREVHRNTSNRRTVIQTVRRSASEIPQSYIVCRAAADGCENIIRRLRSALSLPIGYAEIIIYAVSKIFDNHTRIFGHYESADEICIDDGPEIGVTIDTGDGLYVPILKSDSLVSIESVSEALMGYRFKAMDGSFNSEDMQGGNISISINSSDNVLASVPLVVPGQSAIISIGAPYKELYLSDNGEIHERNLMLLGMAFDHRVINGSEAAEFMDSLIDKINDDSIYEGLLR